MNTPMNSRIFAQKWLEKEGLFDKDSDYEGWLGKSALEVVKFVAKQGHSGASISRMIAILTRIYEDYENGKSPIWKEYWESDEGKALIASIQGA